MTKLETLETAESYINDRHSQSTPRMANTFNASYGSYIGTIYQGKIP
jgi:hypothetical protein